MTHRLIIAAGHGGGDSGAVGQGTTEAAEVIQIVNRVADKLRADGQVEVVVVPHELNLIDEINWVNQRYQNTEDGICIEVHKNATVNGHGIESWYWGGDSQSQSIAQTVLDGIMSVPGMPVSRGTKPDTSNRWGSLGWIRETNPWAILLEMGFVSDGGDGVDDNADNIYAEGIFRGVLRLFGLTPKPTNVTGPTPVQANINFRVYANTVRIGSYQKEENAWNKYVSDNGTKILDANGQDVTAALVAKYRPVVSQPAPGSEPHPEYVEINSKLDQILALVKAILEKLSGVFK